MSAEHDPRPYVARVFVATPAAPPGYEVLVQPGAARALGSVLRQHAPAVRYAILSDATVAALHGDAIAESARAAGGSVELITFAAGESAKTRATWSDLTDTLLARGLGRDSCIIALGGGVTTDLAGFVAATYMRGVPCVHVPTTLLAMIDASIGGKTGVDTPAGKNLVGAFLQPRAVVVDPDLLATLPDRELCSGLAEAVKHGAIADADYFDAIASSAPAILARNSATLAWLIHRSIEIKAAIVARDPEERHERAALNFGHTIGHALERLSGFSSPHGFAVAIGMVAEAELGEAMQVTERGAGATLRSLLERLGLPVAWAGDIPAADLLDAARTDKKARAGRVRFTLLRRIGVVARSPQGDWTHAAETAAVEAALGRAAGARSR